MKDINIISKLNKLQKQDELKETHTNMVIKLLQDKDREFLKQ